jgi:hypothetical protein
VPNALAAEETDLRYSSADQQTIFGRQVYSIRNIGVQISWHTPCPNMGENQIRLVYLSKP